MYTFISVGYSFVPWYISRAFETGLLLWWACLVMVVKPVKIMVEKWKN
jgi:hypothetical protein